MAKSPRSLATRGCLLGLLAVGATFFKRLLRFMTHSLPPFAHSRELHDQTEVLHEPSADLFQPAVPAAPTVDDGLAMADTLDPRLIQLEALLFVAAEPVERAALARAIDLNEQELAELLPALRDYFGGRGIRLQEIDDQLRLVSAPELAPLLERFLGVSQPAKLSTAALEVLAIIAYRQPLTRAQVEAIRGVDSSGVLRSLLARDLVVEVGRAETLGRPILYATTAQFLQIFGLQSLSELPEMELPTLPDAE